MQQRRYAKALILYRPEWDLPEVKDGQLLGSIYYYGALGLVAARFNHLEVYFRVLIGTMYGLRAKASEALLTHVGSATLEESLKSLANDLISDENVKEELLFCNSLFDVNRINRNFLIHSAQPASSDLGFNGILLTRRTARGAVKADHYLLALEAIRRVAEEIYDAMEFIALVTGPCSKHAPGKRLKLPDRPPLPECLAQSHPKGDLFDFLPQQKPPQK